MRTIISVILLPFNLIYSFILCPLARLILKRELESDQERLMSAYKKIGILNEKSKAFYEENNIMKIRLNRLVEIVNKNEHKTRELHLTAKGELVVITYDPKTRYDPIDLFGEFGTNPAYDCRISLSHFIDQLKIADFVSHRRNQGYGRTLLNFTIQYAKRSEYKQIFGDLSHCDSGNFNWLIPFYNSLGFKCELFDEEDKYWEGKICLELN